MATSVAKAILLAAAASVLIGLAWPIGSRVSGQPGDPPTLSPYLPPPFSPPPLPTPHEENGVIVITPGHIIEGGSTYRLYNVSFDVPPGVALKIGMVLREGGQVVYVLEHVATHSGVAIDAATGKPEPPVVSDEGRAIGLQPISQNGHDVGMAQRRLHADFPREPQALILSCVEAQAFHSHHDAIFDSPGAKDPGLPATADFIEDLVPSRRCTSAVYTLAPTA